MVYCMYYYSMELFIPSSLIKNITVEPLLSALHYLAPRLSAIQIVGGAGNLTHVTRLLQVRIEDKVRALE